jgi:hypothetical protein
MTFRGEQTILHILATVAGLIHLNHQLPHHLLKHLPALLLPRNTIILHQFLDLVVLPLSLQFIHHIQQIVLPVYSFIAIVNDNTHWIVVELIPGYYLSDVVLHFKHEI